MVAAFVGRYLGVGFFSFGWHIARVTMIFIYASRLGELMDSSFHLSSNISLITDNTVHWRRISTCIGSLSV